MHPIYYCFIDTSIIYPLISRFIFSSEFLFNTLYYSDKYISHTYHHGYIFSYEIGKCIGASCSTLVLVLLLRLLISENKRINKRMNIIYYVKVILLSIFCLFCVSSFCSVYNHNQLYLIYVVLFSLLFSLGMFPLLLTILCLLCNLKYKNISCFIIVHY